MSRYYTYLIASLPGLYFGMNPPFSYDGFISKCYGLVSEEELETLKGIFLDKVDYGSHIKSHVLRGRNKFEIFLRNELVRIRAARRHIDPARYLKDDGNADLSITHLAVNASRNPSLIESEKYLDEQRWQVLNELSFGHYFDFDVLVIYALKLRILEKWGKIRAADKTALLGNVLNKEVLKV